MYKKTLSTLLFIVSLLLIPAVIRAQGVTYESLDVVYVDETAPAGRPQRGTCEYPYLEWGSGVDHARAVGARMVWITADRYQWYNADATPGQGGPGRPPECPNRPGGAVTTTGAPISTPLLLSVLLLLGVGFIYAGWTLRQRSQKLA